MSQVKGSGRAPWQPPEADLGMIERALGILMAPGSLVELRIPNTPRRGTVSGYFNDLGKMAASAAIMSGKAEGVYLTLNPVKPNLLARAANRLIDYSKHTTANHDVMHLWSFLIDLDPVRPSGISSTDAEHEAAQERARKCRDWLSTQGWPEPVFADSGNGAHLCYRVELPNNNNSSDLLRRCLEALALLLTDQTVEVDLGTYNSARLVKVYGTLAAKGESLRERPHGLARLLEVPAALVAVPLEKFEALARRIPKTEARTAAGQRRQKNDGFDLQRWIDLHNPDVDSPTDWNGGKRWILRRCPWNPDHRDRSAYIVQFGNGAIAAAVITKAARARTGKRCAIWSNQDAEPPSRTVTRANARRKPFRLQRIELQPPVDALPTPIARYAREVSQSLSCPPDLVGVPALSALGALIGTSRVLEVKRGWRERPVVFTAAVSDPGTLKSPALDKALKPTYDLQNQLRAEFEQAKVTYQQQSVEYQAEFAAWQAQVRTIASRKPSVRTADPAEGIESAQSDSAQRIPPEKPQEPLMAQVFTTDSPLEALAELNQQNPRGLLFARDELSGWTRAMNQYRNGKGADRQGWLSFWNGAPVLVNREGKEPILLSNPFVCVAGCLFPDVLDELSDERPDRWDFTERHVIERLAPTQSAIAECGWYPRQAWRGQP